MTSSADRYLLVPNNASAEECTRWPFQQRYAEVKKASHEKLKDKDSLGGELIVAFPPTHMYVSVSDDVPLYGCRKTGQCAPLHKLGWSKRLLVCDSRFVDHDPELWARPRRCGASGNSRLHL